MRDESVGLDGAEKTFRSNVVPSVQSLLFWKVIESIVDLNGVEMLGVVLKPLAFRQTGRIEYLLPMVVIPPGSADANIAIHLSHGIYFNTLDNDWNYCIARISLEIGGQPDDFWD